MYIIICKPTNGGDIIRDTIILLMFEFKTSVIITAIGYLINFNGGILMGIQRKLWIGMLLSTIISWCLAFFIIWIVY